MNQHRSLMAALVVLALLPVTAAAQPSLYRHQKAYGPVPLNALSFHVGFIEGPDHYYLTKHLNEWANQRGGGWETWENWSTSFHTRGGYRRQVSPNHVLATSINYSFLSARGAGQYIPLAEPIVLTTERTLKVHLLSADLGFQYYLERPAPRRITPFLGAGFSVFFPFERLESTFRYGPEEANAGQIYPNPGESISERSYEAGIYGEFGILYFISNRYAAGLDGRYQMSQSRFFIHEGNFVVNYAGTCLSLTMLYFF